MADGNVHTAWIYFSNASGHQCEPRVTQHVLVSSPAVNAAMAIDFTSYTYMHWAPVFLNFDVTYPSGYEGDTPPTSSPHAAYVAMGDSFSSGEGNPPFEMGTDTSYNQCHRSSASYPRLFQEDMEFDSMSFVACSGATTGDVRNGKDSEVSQLDALSEETEVVTITIGGNDIKFKDFATTCVFGGPFDQCDDESDVYEESWDIMTNSSRGDYLPDALTELFQDIADKLTTNNGAVRVYVMGYPYVLTGLSYLSDSLLEPRCDYLTLGEAMAAEAIVEKLDSVISTAVSNFMDYRFQYVDPTDSPGHFAGTEICTVDGYFNGIDEGLIDQAYTFHPNANGQLAYKEVLTDFISQ
ncbi:MAG: hypothetical protein QG549_303 [Patescibacteria group bacterium]|nr:hypothetical protein [Patescibacteria group bacterium]